MTAVACSSKCINITITVGIILSVIGIILIFSYPKIITNKIIEVSFLRIFSEFPAEFSQNFLLINRANWQKFVSLIAATTVGQWE